MVLVMDKTQSVRALELRNRILEMGFPCAVSFPPYTVSHLRPVVCILTFHDAIDVVRRCPLDDVPALVLGEGFVNSLFHAEVFAEEEAMLARMEEYIFAFLGTKKEEYFGFPGYILSGGFAVTKLAIYYRLFPLVLTEREKRIFLTILSAPAHPHSYRRIEAYAFPYPYREHTYEIEGTISSQISAINKEAMAKTGRKMIRYSTGQEDGYILHVRKPVRKQ